MIPFPVPYRTAIFLFLILFCGGAYARIVEGTHDDTVNYSNTTAKPVEKKSFGKMDSKYDPIIEKYAVSYGIDPYLVKCIIKVESDFNPNAVSVAGAGGLMQLMQETAREFGLDDRTDPDGNIRVGVAHFSWLMKEFKGEVPLALAAYHAGIGRVKRAGAVPPIKATVDYVNQVMSWYAGEGDYSQAVKKLYMKIEKDGTIRISD